MHKTVTSTTKRAPDLNLPSLKTHARSNIQKTLQEIEGYVSKEELEAAKLEYVGLVQAEQLLKERYPQLVSPFTFNIVSVCKFNLCRFSKQWWNDQFWFNHLFIYHWNIMSVLLHAHWANDELGCIYIIQCYKTDQSVFLTPTENYNWLSIFLITYIWTRQS